MSLVNPSSPDHVDAISFKSIIIETEISENVEIAAITTNLDVFEHLDKPYITALLGFVDVEDIVGSMNISGGEKVRIVLKTNVEESLPVEKHFYIDKVVSSNKTNDNEEFFTLHLIEDYAFISNTKNVNTVYSGKTSKIIEKIAKDSLDIEVDVNTKDLQEAKVIVPNLTPIDAMCWIKNRSTTSDGYPLYLYSNFIDSNLQLNDLMTMMSAKVMNESEGREFTHYESQATSDLNISRRRIIMAYQAKNINNLYSLIDKGLLGSEYRYLDIIKKEDHKFNFNVDKEVIKQLIDDNIIDTTPLYDSSRYDWSSSKINSRKITRIGSTKVFSDQKSLSERDDASQYRLNEVSHAMSQLLTTDAISFVVNGIDFFDGEQSSTIGKKLRIRFLKNIITDEDDKFDHKKSGDYLIFACKHSFTSREYTLTFSGVKLSNGKVT